jgi:hypothetical protein
VSATRNSCIVEQASCHASLLVRSGVFTTDDWEDLRQELVWDCLRRSPWFDPTRGEWSGFVRGVIRNQATVLVARRRVHREREPLAEDLVVADLDSANGEVFDRLKQPDESQIDLVLDVRRILLRLPSHLQTLAGMLGEASVAEICARMGKSRSRVYQMTRQLRDAFTRAGIAPHTPRRRGVAPCSRAVTRQ